MLYLLCLASPHLDDRLVLQNMARFRSQVVAPPPVLVVHSSGTALVRLCEAAGVFPAYRGEVFTANTPGEAALVDRVLRQVGQRLVAVMTDQGVPAVGLQGGERGLLHRSDAGSVVAGEVARLLDGMRKGVLPCVAASLPDPRHPGLLCEAPLHEAVLALATALQALAPVTPVCLTANHRPGVVVDGQVVARLSLAALPGPEVLAEPGLAQGLCGAGFRVLVTSALAFFSSPDPQGTWLEA
jgi:hypothetical protein